MSSGVQTGSEGYSIRGSRPSETQIRLDGMNMGNQFSGGFGASGSQYFPMVSAYATEEVQIITGNFAAQYGDAQGGIINSVMKTGRTDR
jgi:outer membrane receptor protein involved in Fe transport